MDKNKKKTLTISSGLKKKIDTSSITTSGKKSFSVEKKKSYRPNKSFNKPSPASNTSINPDIKKKNATPTGRISRRYLNEVKTYGVNTAKWKAAVEFCEDRKWEFKIMTEKELGV